MTPIRIGLLSRTMLVTAVASIFAACTPAPGPNQVAVRFYPPPGVAPVRQQLDEAECTRRSAGYVRNYVQCMQALSYRPEIIGAGGIPMSIDQLPSPPPSVSSPSIVSSRPPGQFPPRAPQPQSRTDLSHDSGQRFSQSQVDRLISICPNLPRGTRGPATPLPPGSRDVQACEDIDGRMNICQFLLLGGASRETFQKCLRGGGP